MRRSNHGTEWGACHTSCRGKEREQSFHKRHDLVPSQFGLSVNSIHKGNGHLRWGKREVCCFRVRSVKIDLTDHSNQTSVAQMTVKWTFDVFLIKRMRDSLLQLCSWAVWLGRSSPSERRSPWTRTAPPGSPTPSFCTAWQNQPECEKTQSQLKSQWC